MKIGDLQWKKKIHEITFRKGLSKKQKFNMIRKLNKQCKP